MQPAPVLEPEYSGKPGSSSLHQDSDLLAVKPGTDVLLHGHAHAPGSRPVESVLVSLKMGPLEKVLRVHGIRVYAKGLTGMKPSRALPFVTREITYEGAFGGSDLAGPDPQKHRLDSRNPVGKGVATDPARLDLQAAHWVEFPAGDPARQGPAGFGPLDRAWSPRRELAGTYDEKWKQDRSPLLAADYDPRFAFSAPTGQAFSPALRGGEEVQLTHLTPSGSLRLVLPARSFRFFTRFGRRSVEHSGHLATVLIEPEANRLVAVWQSSLKVLGREVEHLDETRIIEGSTA